MLNLRGVKESGSFFAIPVYFFIASIFIMVGWAIVEMAMGQDLLAESANWEIVAENTFAGAALVFLVARAFSSGTTALTGIEAVANGVPAFKEPKSKNAATTLFLLGAISMTMFAGITWLALKTQVKITEFDSDLIGLPPGEPQKTVLVQIADAVFHHSRIPVYIIAFATATILALAANTAFNGFPVLGSVLARDGYLPRQLHTRGDRLAFSNGILTLAALAAILVIAYQADVSGLIQLYIIGVFVSFTLSQIGMVRHWNRELKTEERPEERRRMFRSRAINAFGLVMTGSVLVIAAHPDDEVLGCGGAIARHSQRGERVELVDGHVFARHDVECVEDRHQPEEHRAGGLDNIAHVAQIDVGAPAERRRDVRERHRRGAVEIEQPGGAFDRVEAGLEAGGAGHHRGGHGVVRRVEFLRPLDVSSLSQRRGPYPPFGLQGGESGAQAHPTPLIPPRHLPGCGI